VGNPELLPLWQNSHTTGHVFTPTSTHVMSESVRSDKTCVNCPTTSRMGSEMNLNKETEIHIVEPKAQSSPRPTHVRRASTTLDLMPSRLPPRVGGSMCLLH